MKKLIYSLFVSSLINLVNAQNPCVRIESILVDACVPGGGCTSVTSPSCSCEGKNEMLRFKVGDNDLNVSDLSVNWPNNPWRGICQNAISAQHVADMNATVQSCGLFIEPTAGVLPAGATVLLITSIEFCVQAHDWGNLSDTIYVIFQCEGNFQGHFANWVTGCDVATGNRTTTISFGAGCTDVATYNRCFLTNQSGGIGGSPAERDGARADFAPDGTVTYPNDGCVAPLEQTTVNASLTSIGNFSFCEGQTISLTGTINGPFVNAFWYGGNGTFSTPNQPQTDYTVASNDSSLTYLYYAAITVCNDTIKDSTLIIVNKIPNVSVTPQGIVQICEGETITLIGQSNVPGAQWNQGGSGNNITVENAGQYIFAASNQCGSDADTVNLVVNPLPEANISSNNGFVLCPGVDITLTGSGGDAYFWLTQPFPTPGSQLSITQPGVYTLVAINDCGVDSTSVTIGMDNAANVSIVGDTILCEGQSITLTAVGNGDFLWNNGSTESQIVVNNPGVYTVQATTLCGISDASTTITFLANPVADIINSNPVLKCENQSVELSSNNQNYFWMGGPVNSSFVVNQEGTYFLVASNACGSDTASISVQNIPSVELTNVSPLQSGICPGQSLTLQVSSNYPTLWSSGQSTSSIQVNEAGIYTAISQGSCDTAAISFTVNQLQNPEAVINEEGPIHFCEGDIVELSTNSEGEILWSTGQSNSLITVSQPGTYTLTITNECGSATAEILVLNQSVNAAFQANPTEGNAPLNVQFTNFSEAYNTLFWDLGNGTTSNQENPVNIYSNPGIYNVVLIASNQFCVDSVSGMVIVFDEFKVEVPNIFSPNNDGTNDIFTIVANGVVDYDLEIYNRWGTKVYRSRNPNEHWDGNLKNGSPASEGVYFYILNISKFDGEKVSLTGNVTLVR